RADEGIDDRGNNATADYNTDLWQQPASDQAADNPDDDVTDQPVATAFDHHAGKPTGNGTNDQPNDECLYIHLSPHFPCTQKSGQSAPDVTEFYSRFSDGPGRREARLMSALGHMRTSERLYTISALPPKADID